ncbi:hypothetical protein DF186_23105, partial [Enterococcus hirae]
GLRPSTPLYQPPITATTFVVLGLDPRTFGGGVRWWLPNILGSEAEDDKYREDRSPCRRREWQSHELP